MKRKFWMPATLAILALTLAPATPAQKKKERSNTRSLHGIVVDKSGTPLEKAVVYLKNTRTLRVRTHIADKEGAFLNRFSWASEPLIRPSRIVGLSWVIHKTAASAMRSCNASWTACSNSFFCTFIRCLIQVRKRPSTRVSPAAPGPSVPSAHARRSTSPSR